MSQSKPINILRFSNDDEIIVDYGELNKFFDHPEIQDRKVVILSVIGAFRGGKSFFLGYCLRFLYAHFPSINNNNNNLSQYNFIKDDNWMGNPDEPLKGFSWRSGTQRETIGINIWNDIFLHTLNGKNIAIIVMDTQGLFDKHSTTTDNSRIFSLGTLISSIQVLNLKQQIQENQLQYLQFATGFAQFISKNKDKMSGKPFQNLTFLIRDWPNCFEFEYGPHGGKTYLEDEVLKIESSQGQELQTVREFIKNSFEQIGCCLLPYPGNDVVTNPEFDGCWSKMDEKFKIELKVCIEHLLMPEHLTLKKLNSQKLTVKQVKVHIEQYLKLFQSGEVPKTLTIFQSMLESSMNSIIKECVDKYKAGVYNDESLNCEQNIPTVHKKWKDIVMTIYNECNKIGDKQHEETFRTQLDQKLEALYREWENIQEQRFRELRKTEDEYKAIIEDERRKKEQAELMQKQREEELKEIQEKMERDAEEMEMKLDEIKKKHEEEQNSLQKRLEKSSIVHYATKGALGASLAAATPIVALSAEAVAVSMIIKGFISNDRESARKNAKLC